VDPKKIFVFTDSDLDGAASLLILHWAFKANPGDIKFQTVTVSNFRKEFLLWAAENSIENYDAVYFLDLDTSTSFDLIDNKKSIVIDHHETHDTGKYKNATSNVVITTSCAKLLYLHFKDKLTSLSNEQKYLIALANDYDSYAFKLTESYNLNCAFSNSQKSLGKNKTYKFLERFYNGFTGFTLQENNIIKEYTTGRDTAISNLQIYSGNVPISKQNLLITGTMGTKYVNDVCDYLLKTYNSDIVFFVNTDSSHVSFRKKKSCNVNLAKLAEYLCGGGGHEYAAGGKISEKFMDFAKQLTPITG
jgi:oligoribonuclease NrnB/cAMP/cGMP phosphodiesterase (DHH superfamily)